MSVYRSAVLVILFLVTLPALCLAKPAPPARFEEIFAEFRHVEELVDEGKWAAATKDIDHVIVLFKEMLPELRKTVSADVTTNFGEGMERYRVSLDRKSKEVSEKIYREIKNIFIELVDSFEFKVSPVLRLVDTDLAEVIEQAKEQEFDEMLFEVRELQDFLRLGRDDFAEYGMTAAEIASIESVVRKINELAYAKNGAEVAAVAQECRGRIAKYLKVR